MLFWVCKHKKMNECLRVAQRKFAYFPSDYAFAFLGYGYDSQFLASVYERSIDAFALKKE
jgi:hypothetical protein